MIRRKLLKCAAFLTTAPKQDVSGTDELPTTEDALPPSVPQMIVDAATRWGLFPNQMLRIAWCESRLGADPNAYNGRSGCYGVFQFKLSTWRYVAWRAGFPQASPLDDFYNIEGAMWLMKNVGPSQWACK